MIPVARKRRTARPQLIVGFMMLASLAGCLNVVDNNDELYKYGAITVRGNGGGTTVNALPNGVFFEAIGADIPDSRTVVNSCAISAVDTTTAAPRGDIRAGSALSLATGVGASKLTTSLPLNPTSLAYIGTSLNYKTGDSATIFVPGEATGFPEATVSVRLAEPIIPVDVVVPPIGQSMNLSWNTADASSAIIVQIKYANPSTRTYANEQVLCSLRDDGGEEIGSTILFSFLNSPADKRSIKFTRWRTAAYNPTATSLLHIVSTVDSIAKLK